MLQLEEDELKGEGNSPENGRKDHVLSDLESSSDKDPVYDSEEALDSHRALESPEVFRRTESSSHSLLNSNLTSSTNLSSQVGSVSGVFVPLRRNTTSLHGGDVATVYSASILARPLPATSHVGQEGQGALSQSPSDTHHGLTEDMQRMKDAR
ncbi:hypothetical protein mRhiFer1_008276 [Rhinolophus ferrumequinum]|uniref:SPATA31 domain-containing protein n=1 Tax=Rhinolophus ferrumequinum TaxID=59479 RepID=A0A7J7VRE2_RHIFE|nr:hypothetical protein mRhiFer1_008276 [Rhinolophus ferrumequinum]